MNELILALALVTSPVMFEHIDGRALTDAEQEKIIATCTFNELDAIERSSTNGHVVRIRCWRSTKS